MVRIVVRAIGVVGVVFFPLFPGPPEHSVEEAEVGELQGRDAYSVGHKG